MTAGRLAIFFWLWLGHAALAQVPETGRWQDFTFTAEAVHEHTALRYREILVDLDARSALDDSRVTLERVRSAAASLIRIAIVMKPAAAAWQWEIHTTSDPDWDAICMAGGKLLVGTRFVEHLNLDDGELATLLGHEIAHALAEHHREELSEVVLLDATHPTIGIETAASRLQTNLALQIRLADLSRIQESEADQLGMTLAHRAGWPVADMVSFYRKLVAVDAPSFRAWDHPSAASRLNTAQIFAVLLDQ